MIENKVKELQQTPLVPCITPPWFTSDFSHGCTDGRFCANSDSLCLCSVYHKWQVPAEPRTVGELMTQEQSTTKGKKPVDKPLATHPSRRNSRRDPRSPRKSQGDHVPMSTVENSFTCSYFGLCFFPHSLSPMLGISSPIKEHAQVVVPGKQPKQTPSIVNIFSDIKPL